MALTDAQIRSLKPEGSERKYSDGGGLYLAVTRVGTKTFRVKHHGKTITLGTYPDMRLTDARSERDRIKRGEEATPAAPAVRPEPSPDKPPSDAWSEVADRYFKYRVRDGMHYRTRAKLERQVAATVAVIGGKRIADVTAPDILEIVRPYEDAGKVETAHEIRSRCSQIFEFAKGEGIPNMNPATVVTKAMVRRKRGKFPGLTEPRAVGRLMRTIRSFDLCEPQIRTALLLSAYLFPRNDQLRGMRWDEIDFQTNLWEIPKARMKGADAQDQIVPLPRQAVALLREIRAWTGDSPLVIPAPRDFRRKVSDSTFNSVLRRMGYCTKTVHCHHGFRTTASTNLNEMGFNRDWIERQLAHVDEDTVRRGYNKAQYLEGRTRMMQEYADWLDAQERAA